MLKLSPSFASQFLEGNPVPSCLVSGDALSPFCTGFAPNETWNTRLVRNLTQYPIVQSKFQFPFDAAASIVSINGTLHFWIFGGRHSVVDIQ